ncbi:MAG: arsenate reductase ArsC [Spirochaetae bacterium HGW-Spirochaetae-3]|jgi:arsenate reductase|nr:MAG: arsenate reductase ArsC [Spirochaetae bacterium HGW-Spirochaetae-3]
MTKVLFLCVHNSARSQIAEAYLTELGGSAYRAESAGLEPGRLNPYVVRALAEDGIDIAGKPTRGVFDIARSGGSYDVVVTVCDGEAAGRCPTLPGVSERLHWPFPDPSGFSGDDDDIMAGVRAVRDDIKDAVARFIAGRA